MNCPSCDARMEKQTFEGNYGRPVPLDMCYSCSVIWFDSAENLQLTPGSVLKLFKLIHEKHALHSKTPDRALQCPRCQRKLKHTHDLLYNVRFSYALCPQNHGRLSTFFQFLREKKFIRDLTTKEIEELKRRIQMVHCSNCGASINLNKDSRCPYCHSAISMLDPQQMEKTVQELRQLEERQATPSRQPSTATNQSKTPTLSAQPQRYHDGVFSSDPFLAADLAEGAIDLVSAGIELMANTFSDS